VTRSKRASLIPLGVIALVLICFLTACSAASYSPSTTYTYGNASSAVLALNAGMLQASISPITKVCYATPGTGNVTFTFIGYYEATGSYITAPYTLTGSLVEVTGVSINGTVNFTGGTVTQITYNNVVASPPSGTYQITFVGGLVYIYNLATGTFTLS
jgi:hypothetical protein